jgi:hypothetical protein
MTEADERQIDALVAAFFALFSNRGGAVPNLRAIFDLCIPQAVISKTPEVDSLETFIAPREVLLTGGTLVDFEEFEVSHRTGIFGTVAQRASVYIKRGVMKGVPFETRGSKVFQFIKTAHGWRISAVAWTDEA